MLKINFKRVFTALLLFVIVQGFSGCKSSDFTDIFLRCDPECTDFESPVPIQEVTEAFTQVIDTIVVDETTLTGRWVMFSATRYVVDQDAAKSVNDLLFTRSMVFTEGINEVTVSDCEQDETYALTETGFTIPQDSVFFNSLYFENENAIEVEQESNILLSADWVFTTPQNTQASVEIGMYKVSDDPSPATSLGKVENTDDIYCYSYLHVFSNGEQIFNNQWVPVESEIKELLLKIDPASGDENIYLLSQAVNGVENYVLRFNQNIPAEEYLCPGLNSISSSAEDHLSFAGFFNITSSDIECVLGGRSESENTFSFNIL